MEYILRKLFAKKWYPGRFETPLANWVVNSFPVHKWDAEQPLHKEIIVHTDLNYN